MNKHTSCQRVVSLSLALTIFFSSCVSTTLIQSNPPGARIYVDGTPVGVTPYKHSDTKILTSNTDIRLEKEGYETLYTSFSRDEEFDVLPLVCGFCIYVPWLWAMKYKPTHFYELRPLGSGSNSEPAPAPQKPGRNKSERLRELKLLYDEKLISQEEYEKERKKILEEDGN